MNAIEFLKSLNSTTDKINRSINPLKLNEWLPKINTGIAFNELMKGMSYHNNFIHNDLLELSKRVSWNYDFNKTVMSQLNNNMAMNINNAIFDKINSVGYWGNIAKLSLINGSQIFIDDDELFVSEIIENNFEDINNAIEEIEENPIEFFNKIVVYIKSYMDNNPSIKYSGKIITFIVSIYITVLITNSLSNTNDEKPTVNQVFNSYTINNHSTGNINFKVNCKSISLKNYPRDNSKSVSILFKNDKVKILKDSLKWVFVIKENSVETGWIRKEFLNYK
ncbi:hypothetical protein CYV15_02665 [Riemerella anatipestifer]|uniref:hypothetical protein n=1 Tax=Riemerella anatipestifer TaxID=34085 RepID=UPI000D13FE37|nr:hypothetical protein [Riemerella anatipestifer]PST44625.1 hypothetical protein CYV15_02665 [Riemerella anatipestifer]